LDVIYGITLGVSIHWMLFIASLGNVIDPLDVIHGITLEVSIHKRLRWFMVFIGTFNNISVISWQSVLLVEEAGGPRENH